MAVKRIKVGEGTFAITIRHWKEDLSPGDRLTTREMAEMINRVDDLKTVSSALCAAVSRGMAARADRLKTNEIVWERVKIPEDDKQPDAVTRRTAEAQRRIRLDEEAETEAKDLTEVRLEEIGAAILMVIKNRDTLIRVQTNTISKRVTEIKELVEANKQLKQLVDEQSMKIVELQKSNKAKTIDLHKLAEYRNHLPNQEGKSA
ncbi:MAG: hypothetical protein ACYSW3_00120 [Planctomycetota bacterium]